MPAAIDIRKLSKRYPGTDSFSLKDLTLSVQPGEVYGFLGANGAGKSTTIRLLLNFLQPTSGTAQIVGNDVVRASVAAKRHVGYLAGEIALYQKATARQFFDYMAALQPLPDPNYFKELVRRFDVELDKPLQTLSKGNRQKIGLLQAFMHQPSVLILDEPTSGLDPLMQEEFFKLVQESKDRGAAIFLSSHNLAEAQHICDRVGIIKHGKLIREQAVDQTGLLGKPLFRVKLAAAADVKKLQHDKQLVFVSRLDDLTLVMQPTTTIAAALKALSAYDIAELTSQQPDLESEFLEFYGEGS